MIGQLRGPTHHCLRKLHTYAPRPSRRRYEESVKAEELWVYSGGSRCMEGGKFFRGKTVVCQLRQNTVAVSLVLNSTRFEGCEQGLYGS